MAAQGKRIRLTDVARAAEVSLATASRSLSGAEGVSRAVAERVRAMAAELGYTANVHAQSLAAGTSRTVGLIVHDISDAYFSEIASGVLETAAAAGYSVQISHTGRVPDRTLSQIRQHAASRAGAIILAGSGFIDPVTQQRMQAELETFRDNAGQVAVIGRHDLPGASAVLPENIEGGRAICRHLLELGHRRLAVISGVRTMTTVIDRLQGVAQACSEYGINFSEVPLIEGAFNRRGGKEAATRVLREHPDRTAILALNDDMAIGALSVLRAHRIEVPSQMSVAGFDDVAVAEDLSPALTTVRLPLVEMGRQAMQLVLQPSAPRSRQRRIAHSLVVRSSTGQPAQQVYARTEGATTRHRQVPTP